jgi:hypothetical protein
MNPDISNSKHHVFSSIVIPQSTILQWYKIMKTGNVETRNTEKINFLSIKFSMLFSRVQWSKCPLHVGIIYNLKLPSVVVGPWWPRSSFFGSVLWWEQVNLENMAQRKIIVFYERALNEIRIWDGIPLDNIWERKHQVPSSKRDLGKETLLRSS